MIRNEFHLFSQDSINYSKQFIPGSNDSLATDHFVISFSDVIVPEDTIVSKYRAGNEIADPSKVADPPFGYFSSFNRLFNTGIRSGIGNQLFVVREALNVFHFTKEMTGSYIADAFNRLGDFQFVAKALINVINQFNCDFIQMCLKKFKVLNIELNCHFQAIIRSTDEFFGQIEELIRVHIRVISPGFSRIVKGFSDFLFCDFSNRFSRRKQFKNMQKCIGKYIGMFQQFQEGNIQHLLQVCFGSTNVSCDGFSKSGKLSKISSLNFSRDGHVVLSIDQKPDNSDSVNGIGFCFSQRIGIRKLLYLGWI